MREAPNDNLLLNPIGVDVVAQFEWDGVKFVVKGIINQSVLDSNINYKLSAQIRTKILI